MKNSLYLAFLLILCVIPANTIAQQKIKLNPYIFGQMESRQIGPASMSGRVTAIDAVEKEPRIIYVGAAGGGIWKSINGGASFKPVFDKYNQSIGCLTIDQKHPDTVWTGTGESNMRNSVSVGDGIYRSVDGGSSWIKAGLDKSEHISKIVIDPSNSSVIYAAIPGALWSDSEERGLYKSTNFGKSWDKILYVDEKTGCADLEVDPREPNRIYAAMWQFRRTPWSFSSGGQGSGLYKSEDFGKSWKRIDKQFSQDGILGRICLAVAPTAPNNVYAMVESKKTALYSSTDYGENWTKESATENATARPFYFSVLKVDPTNEKRIYRPTFSLSISKDGGKSFSESGSESGWVHSDHHAIWIDPKNPSYILLGTDAGVYMSLDKAENWRFLNNLPLSQFYHVSYDNEFPYNVMGGLQDNGSWVGPSRSSNGIKNGDWKVIGGGDGFAVFRDRINKDIFYSEYQGGEVQRYNIKTNELKSIKPYPLVNEPKLRFNWNTPIQFSPNDNKVMYIGAQYLYRTTNMGDTWQRISPDLTTNDPEKQKQEESGGLSVDNSAAENHCTIFTICESPKNNKIIWAGTDDGNVQVTTNAGKSWNNITNNITGLPKNTWCSSIDASPFDANTAFATFDGHAFGDMNTYLFKTSDMGKSWVNLNTADSNCISGSYAHKIKQDIVNKDLLFLGTEFGLYISIDGGNQWSQFTGRTPNVAIRDIVIKPETSDLILATHGRGIFIIDDITPLRALNDSLLLKDEVILPTRPNYLAAIQFGQGAPTAGEFLGLNPNEDFTIAYYLKDRVVVGDVNIEISDKDGRLIKRLPGTKRKGINKLSWDLRMKPPKIASAVRLSYGGLFGPFVPEGTYTIKLIKGDKVLTKDVVLTGDPNSPHSKEERALQYKTTMQLYDLQENLAFLNELINRVKKEVTLYQDSVKNTVVMKEFNTKLDSLSKTLAASKEGTGITGEERLREKLSGLYMSVAFYPGKPTDSQIQRTQALSAELNNALANKDKLFGLYLDIVNNELQAAGKSKISPYTREQFALDKEKEKG